jgi:hypothetical protein
MESASPLPPTLLQHRQPPPDAAEADAAAEQHAADPRHDCERVVAHDAEDELLACIEELRGVCCGGELRRGENG